MIVLRRATADSELSPMLSRAAGLPGAEFQARSFRRGVPGAEFQGPRLNLTNTAVPWNDSYRAGAIVVAGVAAGPGHRCGFKEALYEVKEGLTMHTSRALIC